MHGWLPSALPEKPATHEHEMLPVTPNVRLPSVQAVHGAVTPLAWYVSIGHASHASLVVDDALNVPLAQALHSPDEGLPE